MPKSTSHISEDKPEVGQWAPGYEGLYSVTKNGCVYSYHSGSAVKLKTPPNGRGYQRVNLYRDGSKKQMKVHRLVAITFLPDPDNTQTCVRHIDGNKLNNNCGNLAWSTHSENMNDRKAHGTSNRGTRNGHAKLDECSVEEIRIKYRDTDITQDELASAYRVNQATVWEIIWGKIWGWASGPIKGRDY
jgi:hypothetical protein